MTNKNNRALRGLPDDAPEPDAAERIAALEAEVEGLRQAMVERATIEQAKGMLMMRFGMSEPAAFDYLVRCSSASNIKLRLVARVLVDLAVEEPTLPEMDAGPAGLVEAVLHRSR